jgi:S-phase kinase-associated protein 1
MEVVDEKQDTTNLSLDDADHVPVKIRLVAKDGVVCTIDKKACQMSKFIINSLEDKSCEEIVFDKVDSLSLKEVCRYLEHHQKIPPKVIEKPLKSPDMSQVVDDWDAKFSDVDQDTMFSVMLAANYLGIEPLLMLMCAKCASLMKGKPPAEIRKIFNIRDDYTPEEEEAVRKEYGDLLN